MSCEIYTIGHSILTSEKFVELLKRHAITAIADVRSAPYSRHNPQFNQEELRSTLKAVGIKYVFLGKELGARSADECCYVDDKVQYDLLARIDLFQSGIRRVIEGASTHRIALMCAERDPLDCHRTILVARELAKNGCAVWHILHSGALETHQDAICRLVERLGFGEQDMFRSEMLSEEEAYTKQGNLIAYSRKVQLRIGLQEKFHAYMYEQDDQ